jgi:DNA-binding beta-propeller fold protein YncE
VAVSNHLRVQVYPAPPVSISVNGDTLRVYNAVACQWYLNGVAITGATNQIYVIKAPGSYTIAVTDSNGCSETSNPFVYTNIIESLSDRVDIYPNPLTAGNWHLYVSNNLIGAELQVFDDTGNLVYQSKIQNSHSEINFNCSAGVYMLRISSLKSNIVKRLIKL